MSNSSLNCYVVSGQVLRTENYEKLVDGIKFVITCETIMDKGCFYFWGEISKIKVGYTLKSEYWEADHFSGFDESYSGINMRHIGKLSFDDELFVRLFMKKYDDKFLKRLDGEKGFFSEMEENGYDDQEDYIDDYRNDFCFDSYAKEHGWSKSSSHKVYGIESINIAK